MAKLFFTEIPTREELEKSARPLYPDMDPLTLYSHILLRKVTTEMEINLDSFFSRYNLSSGRFTLMILLHRASQGLMPSELAQKVGVTQATISGLINSLEKVEIVKRTTHEKDGRSFVILLTDKGRALCDEIVPLYHERITQFWSEFNESEKNQINGFTERMIRSIPKLGQ
ncbi:MAG: marR family transcriptional regulator [Bdellovibrio sp. ArHS]|uniref:MarR family winged helix-turn-helix transcriptional regulator n=1 Tax=Bdellovibrio sp. ArHS TaxID=1569284 RepID=UPI000583E100|nr:MarR family transcriptional regulator [Bdellovibrio sp. ArHS]KHD89773.1 MAG: marR family transcriptional regulator [Bdellovibrio sp. ArHS]